MRWGHLAVAAKTQGVALPVVDGLLADTSLAHKLTPGYSQYQDFTGLGLAVLNPWSDRAVL